MRRIYEIEIIHPIKENRKAEITARTRFEAFFIMLEKIGLTGEEFNSGGFTHSIQYRGTLGSKDEPKKTS